jgi:hypothetical protein
VSPLLLLCMFCFSSPLHVSLHPTHASAVRSWHFDKSDLLPSPADVFRKSYVRTVYYFTSLTTVGIIITTTSTMTGFTQRAEMLPFANVTKYELTQYFVKNKKPKSI